MRLIRLVLMFAVLLSVWSCRRNVPNETVPEADYLLVDRQMADYNKSVSPDGIESAFTVSCDADWEVSVQEDAAAWISVGEKTSTGKNTWSLPYIISSNESIIPRSAGILFKAGEHSIKVTLEQGVPDPLTLNKVPGFYGIDGSNVIPSGTRQSSSFRFGDRWAYRILDPSTLTVYALGSIPWDLEPGSRISVGYKVVSEGMEVTYEPSLDVEVVRVTGSMVWLRRSESEYFILER